RRSGYRWGSAPHPLSRRLRTSSVAVSERAQSPSPNELSRRLRTSSVAVPEGDDADALAVHVHEEDAIDREDVQVLEELPAGGGAGGQRGGGAGLHLGDPAAAVALHQE